MSNTIGTVIIDIKGDTSKLVTGMKRAEKSVNRAVGNMKKTIGGLAAAYISLQAATKAFDMALKQSSQMIKVAANFERFDAVLKTIEGDSSKAKKSLEWVQDFASTTPFNIDKVTSSFISLKSYGLEPTDGLLRTLGDTSAAMGKDIQQAVEAMADAVVGENERLKEFGIRAKVAGEEIKYSWTNSSGEMRETVIGNNSAMIESTLSAIFNSKYEGAMEEQSKTWNGLISNMQDNWTIFQKNLMDSGIFDYLKSIITVVGDYMGEAFNNTLESSKSFTDYTIQAIRATIESLGGMYDSLETLGDYFSVVGNLGAVAFYGLQAVTSTVADGIWESFEWVFNKIIDGINYIFDLAESASFGAVSFQRIATVDWTADTSAREDFVYMELEKAKQDLAASWDNLMTTGEGSTFTDNFLSQVDEAYANIQNAPSSTIAKVDFGDSPTADVVAEEVTKLLDYTVDTALADANTVTQVEETQAALDDMIKTIKADTGDDDVYTVVNNVNDSFNETTNILNDLDTAVDSASYALDDFIFKFENTFIDSIKNNISSLESIASDSAFSIISYEDALASTISAQDSLIENPLDVGIGEQFSDAYAQYISSATSYLGDSNNFDSTQDLAYETALVAAQSAEFQETAVSTIDILESMNNFLELINQSFADGILSADEIASIEGVAAEVNAKNEELLVGTNSVGTFIKDITASGTYSLADIDTAVNGVADATGLTTAEVANVGLQTGSIDDKTAIDATTSRTSWGVTGETPQYTTRTASYYDYDLAKWVTRDYRDFAGVTHDYGWTTGSGYDLGYATGGFTGNGFGQRDASGFKKAGIVHEDEWVAPKWMIDSNPSLFGVLEASRQNGNIESYSEGGMVTKSIKMPTIQASHKKIQIILNDSDNSLNIISLISEAKKMNEKMDSQNYLIESQANEIVKLRKSSEDQAISLVEIEEKIA